MGVVVPSVLPLLLALTVTVPVRVVVELGAAAPTSGTWAWPVVGPVMGTFDPPDTPFGAGHRGIDIATGVGTVVIAPEPGIVAFAGRIGGELFVTLDHGAGLTSTYSWLSSSLVRKGDSVPRGAAIALSGRGHPDSTTAHLHFGVRRDGVYLDPLSFLVPPNVSEFIRLAPLDDVAA
ncbi:MAG TPA: M23 family metallopeptidase [Actinomycetota bacterium]|nr:M23 family metallopeptidase [Actinomycetota bacterium]